MQCPQTSRAPVPRTARHHSQHHRVRGAHHSGVPRRARLRGRRAAARALRGDEGGVRGGRERCGEAAVRGRRSAGGDAACGCTAAADGAGEGTPAGGEGGRAYACAWGTGVAREECEDGGGCSGYGLDGRRAETLRRRAGGGVTAALSCKIALNFLGRIFLAD